MKVAIVYNRDSQRVINLFGMPNQEKIGKTTIERIANGLKKGGHQVQAFEGDKDLIDRLEHFMPRVLKGELPGLVFNVSYGIQGQARYTHVPSILEMVGVPYVASGPLAHSLALDKVVAKMIFKQHGISTPDFAVLERPDFPAPDLEYPLIVKPKNEAVSFGLKIVNSEAELREGAGVIFEKFNQAVLAERYIEGREVNVGLLGNNPPEVLPPVELVFGEGGPRIYSYEDKTQKSGRDVGWDCPAPIGEKLTKEAGDLAVRAFDALGCYDCARVDMRLDERGNLYVLEINSLPSMGEHGSFTIAAQKAGLEFDDLVCRLVEVASARYFGTPSPPPVAPKKKDPAETVFSYLVERRDEMEKRVESWTHISSRTLDPTGIHEAHNVLSRSLSELKLSGVSDLTDGRKVWTWQTKAGLAGGTLLLVQLDVPLDPGTPAQTFRRDPEWLYGEGVGVSRAPLVSVLFALRALRAARRLATSRIGVMVIADEGGDGIESQKFVREGCSQAKQVFVMRPGFPDAQVVSQRRGWRRYRLSVSEKPRRLGKVHKHRSVLRWASIKLEEITRFTTTRDRLAVAVSNLHTEAFPKLLPHRVNAELFLSFLDVKAADRMEEDIFDAFTSKDYRVLIERTTDRPPMKRNRRNERLFTNLKSVADAWEIPLTHESSLYPSAAGLVPKSVGVICGMGAVAKDLDTSQEAILRMSLVQRTLLLAQFLVGQSK
jgi:D-alanine-D-alanine ligase